MSSSESAHTLAANDPRIAVIGLACRFPGAAGVVELWENVLAGRRQFRSIPDQRMPLRHYYDADSKAPDKTYARKAAVIDGFSFDWIRSKIPRSTFESADVSHWLALDVAEAAMRTAGQHDGPVAAEKFGVIVGNTLTGEQIRANSMRLRWPYVRSALLAALDDRLDRDALGQLLTQFERRYKQPFPPIGEDTLAGSLSNTIAGRICGRYDLGGGGYTVDAACASSLLAVVTAADRLLAGDLDVALAGGVDVSLDPFELVGFAKAGALARGTMRVYDQRAAGFVPGEGCGFVVLRRLRDAVTAGDRIFAVLRGWGVSSDGRHPIMAPRLEGQVRALERAYARAGLDPGVVDFVEGHGTGTIVGDRIEITALGRVIGSRAQHPVGITSLKAVVGHCKAAAGIGALIKTVIAVNRRCIPPVPGCERPSEVFDQGPGRLFPVRTGVSLPTEREPVAGVSAMGFGGINVHVVVQAAGPPSPELAPALPERALLASGQEGEALVLDAHDHAELLRQIDALRDAARGMSTAELVDLAAACARREGGGALRAVVLAEDEDVLCERLEVLRERVVAGTPSEGHREAGLWLGEAPSHDPPRVGFLFPGQGSQRVGAARFLVERFEWARALAAKAARVAADHGTPDLLDVLYPPEPEPLDDSRLINTRYAQPGVCLVSLLWARWLRGLGVVPNAATGHSLGELGALHVAELVDEQELLHVAALRGAVVTDHAEPGAMVALATSVAEAEALVAELSATAWVSNINGARQVVVAVEPHAVETVLRAARRHGIAATSVPVSHGFHSELVAPAARVLRERLGDGGPRQGGKVEFISGLPDVTGSRIESLGEHLARQLRQPVDFRAQVRAIARACDVLVELGPGDVLTRLARAELGADGLTVVAVEPVPGRFTALHGALAELYVRGVPVRWERLYEHRLVRPFVPASEREFIVNPCGLLGEYAIGPEPELPAPAPAEVEPVEVGGELSLAMVRELIAVRTGFPLEIITESSRFIDDLNLDSIKSGEVIVAAAARARVVEHVDATALTNATVGELHRAIEQARRLHGGSACAESLRLGAWVRGFAIKRKLVEPQPRTLEGLPRPSALWVAGRKGPWVEALSKRWDRAVEPPGACVESRPNGVVALVAARPSVDAWEWSTLLVEPLRHLAIAAASAAGLVVIEAASDEDAVDGGSLVGFLRSVALESPQCRVRLVTAAPGTEASLVDALERMWGEAPSFVHVRIDARGRWWRDYAVPLPPPVPGRDLGEGDVVLVTGGGRGITYECGRALALATGCRLALVGRSSPREGEELAANLQRLKDAGVVHGYARADVADADQLRAAVAVLERALGPITAAVHGAGSNVPRRAREPSSAEVLAEISPKVRGLVNVLDVARERSLRACVGLGSVIATTGMHGNAWYALANGVLAAELAAFGREHSDAHVLSVDFGAWAEVGMAARLGTVEQLYGKGLAAIEPEEGARRFVALARGSLGSHRVVVTGPVDPATWPSVRAPSAPARFVAEDALVAFSGVECRTRVALDVAREPSLLDHRYQGTLLFPAVYGLEAMAEVARVALDGAGPVRCLTDVEFEHPIVVHEDQLVRIEIRALVGEIAEDGLVSVTASIRSESTGYAKDHFRATLHVQSEPAEQDEPSPVRIDVEADPWLSFEAHRDLYGPLLFQGPCFQRIGRVLRFEPPTIAFELEPSPPGADVRAELGSAEGRDALLQGGQTLVPQADALPERIERIELLGPRFLSGRGVGQVRLVVSDAEGFVVDAQSADPDGVVLERMIGARFRRLRVRPDRPSLELLRSPSNEGTALLQRCFAAEGLDARVRLVFHDGLGDAPGPVRHAVLDPLLRALAGEVGAEPSTLEWTEQGPRLGDGWLSVAHDRSFGIAVASRRRVGVDLEPIVSREPDLWRGLLGHDRHLLDAVRGWATDDDDAWTRLWAAREALFKLTQQHGLTLEVREAHSDRIELAAVADGRRIRIASWRVTLGRGGPCVVALAMEDDEARPARARAKMAELETRLGSQGRTAVIHRFVTSFADCIAEGGTVPASRLAMWMGHARELALLPLRHELLPLFESGRWGAVTNHAHVEQLAPLGAMSRIEVAIEAQHVDEVSASMALVFTRLDGDVPEVIGRAGQRFTWVELAGGKSRPAPLPAAVREYLVGFGAETIVAPAPAPGLGALEGAPLTTLRLQTTREDTNLVGNVYFAQYFRWVERVLERDPATVGRPVRSCVIEFVRESRPGETIEMSLYGRDAGRDVRLVEISSRGDGSLSRLSLARAELG